MAKIKAPIIGALIFLTRERDTGDNKKIQRALGSIVDNRIASCCYIDFKTGLSANL